MEILSQIFAFFGQFMDVLLHVDVHLQEITQQYGTLVYLFLFIIIFCETGLVVTPFLPGDSLLFACGAMAGLGLLSYPLLLVLILSAAIIGDFVNYRIGHHFGPPVFEKNYRFLKREYLLRAHEFYERHGGKAIVLARFVPIIRTFAPFVAGVASMHPGRFLMFNVSGATAWVLGFLTLGFFFGNQPFVKQNFSLVVIAIIVISVMPMVVEILRNYLNNRRKAVGNEVGE